MKLKDRFLRSRDSGSQPVTAFSALLFQRGITTQALAKALGYSFSAVKAWRTCQRVPKLGARLMLTKLLRLSSARLLQMLSTPHTPNTGAGNDG